jgi:TPR repeat protein
MYELGLCHERGFGTKQDAEKAKRCYRAAADNGQKQAADRLRELE